MLSETLIILITLCVSFANTSGSPETEPFECVDKVDSFREVTRLPDITCEQAYQDLHEDCVTDIPTAKQFKLWDFCCAYCRSLTYPTTMAPTKQPTAEPTDVATSAPNATEKSEEESDTNPDTDNTTDNDENKVETTKTAQTYTTQKESSYGTAKTTGESGYGGNVSTTGTAGTADESVANNSNKSSSEDYESPIFILVTVVVAIIFVAGWIIMWFELEKKGWWERQSTERTTKFEEVEESDPENGDEEDIEKRFPHQRHQSTYSNLGPTNDPTRFPPNQHQRMISSPFPTGSSPMYPHPHPHYNPYGPPLTLPHGTLGGPYPQGPHGPPMAPMMLPQPPPEYYDPRMYPPQQNRRKFSPERDASYSNQHHYKNEDDHGDQTESSRHQDQSNNPEFVYEQL